MMMILASGLLALMRAAATVEKRFATQASPTRRAPPVFANSAR
jgi:hypothetical protein